MVHHFPHEIDVGHEDGGVALFEEEGESLEAGFKVLVFCGAHVFCKLQHSFGSFGLILGGGDGGDEKL